MPFYWLGDGLLRPETGHVEEEGQPRVGFNGASELDMRLYDDGAVCFFFWWVSGWVGWLIEDASDSSKLTGAAGGVSQRANLINDDFERHLYSVPDFEWLRFLSGEISSPPFSWLLFYAIITTTLIPVIIPQRVNNVRLRQPFARLLPFLSRI